VGDTLLSSKKRVAGSYTMKVSLISYRLRRDEVMAGWRGLHNEELHIFVLFTKYNYNDQVEEDEMGWAYSTNGSEEECMWVIGRKAEGNRLLGRPRLTCVDNIRMDLGEVGWCDVDWIGLTLVNKVMNLWVP
jgi:hypothetical protein